MITQLDQQIKENKLPHALLFVGHGCEAEVESLAQRLLAVHEKDLHLLSAQTHPDYQVIKKEPKSSHISIDAIREITHFCTQTPQISDKKIIVLLGAETLNAASSNALLKTLEEPPGNTYFFLTTHLPTAILPTIRSRCQIVYLNDKQKELPSWQVSLSQDCDALLNGKLSPLTMAAKWQKEDILLVLDVLYEHIAKKLYQQISPNYFQYLDNITRLRKIVLEHRNVNMQLQLEALLISLVT